MFEGAPEDLQAIVVGVDEYKACEAWNLIGPTRDALNTVEWLCEQGVPEENITLFLSPGSWETQLVEERLASKTSLLRKPATSHAFAQYINEELPGITATALLFHWGGHGVVGDRADKQYLYTADATKAVPHCVCAQELLDTFHAPHFGNLKQQVFVFDVCANQGIISLDDPLPVPVRLVQTRILKASISQCEMYGASLGNRAANTTGIGREGGLFSRLLFEELRNYTKPGMRQFIGSFRAITQIGRFPELRKQVPKLIPPSGYDSHLTAVQSTNEAEQLLALIRKIDPSHARLKRLYLQSQPLIELRTLAGDPEEWMRDLADNRASRSEGHPSPLVEFAERLGRELSAPDLQEWARAQCAPGQYPTLQRTLDEESKRTEKEFANLFIEVRQDGAPEFSWWLEGPGLEATNTQSVAIDSRGLRANLIETLPGILEHAAGLVRRDYELRIGFIVPASFLCSGLESIAVKLSEDDDPPSPLNHEYPVLFHWSERASGRYPHTLNKWGSLVEMLQARVERGDGGGVIWLEQDDPADKMRYTRAYEALHSSAEAAISLGIEHPPGDLASIPLETIKLCLKRGIPCLFWLQQSAEEGEARALRDRVNAAFARQVPFRAPLSLLSEERVAKRQQQLGLKHILWDLPAYLPEHNPTQSLLEDHYP